LFVKYPDGVVYEGQVWPYGHTLQTSLKRRKRLVGEKLSAMLKQGVEGFWNDMNEPSVWGQAFPDMVQFYDNGFGASHRKFIMFMRLKKQEQLMMHFKIFSE